MMLPENDVSQGAAMGEVRVELKPTSLFEKKSVDVRALVDTGASRLIITPEVAKALGYDLEECIARYVEVADGRRVEAPHIEALKVEFEDRDCSVRAAVLCGSECLLGAMA